MHGTAGEDAPVLGRGAVQVVVVEVDQDRVAGLRQHVAGAARDRLRDDRDDLGAEIQREVDLLVHDAAVERHAVLWAGAKARPKRVVEANRRFISF